jgi:hypothetical protein
MEMMKTVMNPKRRPVDVVFLMDSLVVSVVVVVVVVVGILSSLWTPNIYFAVVVLLFLQGSLKMHDIFPHKSIVQQKRRRKWHPSER